MRDNLFFSHTMYIVYTWIDTQTLPKERERESEEVTGYIISICDYGEKINMKNLVLFFSCLSLWFMDFPALTLNILQ